MNNIRIRNKGNSILELINNYTLIDIETTGWDYEYDEIIEISAIKVRNNNIVDTYSSLIKPKNDIDMYITRLTGITNEMLIEAPSINKKIEEYINFIDNDVIVGYNVNFDINFLYDVYIKNSNKKLSNDYVDVLRLCKKLIKDSKNHKLSTMCEYFNISQEIAHRALEDCKITYELFNIVKEKIINDFGNVNELFKKINYNSVAKEMIPQNNKFDEEHPLYNKTCVFTGKLSLYERMDAMQKVINLGGKISDHINKETNYLIVGNFNYLKEKHSKSNKLKKAEEYKLNNLDIEIISENVFYDLLNQ